MQIQENISLWPYNTFGIDVSARYFISIKTIDDLQEILSSSHSHSNMLVLGGGSNVLLTKDYDGTVLKNDIPGIEPVNEDEDHYYIKVGAGENWHQFVIHCVHKNYAGLENLSLIPGNVGASPMQNIGAYGVEIKDVFHQLEAFDLKEKTTRIFSLQDCQFGYRDSVFKQHYKDRFVITSVTYRLRKKAVYNTSYGAIQQELERMAVTELTIKAISDAVINIRSSKLPNPKEVGNAGSFFKNPVITNLQFQQLKVNYPGIIAFPSTDGYTKVAAGWLIEQCGWKGFRKGDAGCYPKQALVLVNYGSASGKEIYDLSTDIINSVQSKFGIILHREVNII